MTVEDLRRKHDFGLASALTGEFESRTENQKEPQKDSKPLELKEVTAISRKSGQRAQSNNDPQERMRREGDDTTKHAASKGSHL